MPIALHTTYGTVELQDRTAFTVNIIIIIIIIIRKDKFILPYASFKDRLQSQ